eukprot:COSAG02_NODE_1173_length_14105_cov_15.197701_8_plen_163_part_00
MVESTPSRLPLQTVSGRTAWGRGRGVSSYQLIRDGHLGNRTKPFPAKRPKTPTRSQLGGVVFAWATFYRPRPARFGVLGPNVTPSTSLFWFLGKLGACRIKSNSQSNSWATERSPDRWPRAAADLSRDGADDGGVDRGAGAAVVGRARTGLVCTHEDMCLGA